MTRLSSRLVNTSALALGVSAMTSSSEEDASSGYLYPLPITVTVGVAMSLLAGFIVIFNTITIVAFACSPSLRKFGDYFILNLAVSGR